MQWIHALVGGREIEVPLWTVVVVCIEQKGPSDLFQPNKPEKQNFSQHNKQLLVQLLNILELKK